MCTMSNCLGRHLTVDKRPLEPWRWSPCKLGQDGPASLRSDGGELGMVDPLGHAPVAPAAGVFRCTVSCPLGITFSDQVSANSDPPEKPSQSGNAKRPRFDNHNLPQRHEPWWPVIDMGLQPPKGLPRPSRCQAGEICSPAALANRPHCSE